MGKLFRDKSRDVEASGPAFGCTLNQLRSLMEARGAEAIVRNMVIFSSIVTELQLTIAEKMDYRDQEEFELSSKLGKGLVRMATRKAAVEVDEILINSKELCFKFADNIENGRSRRRRLRKWETLCQFSELLRFKVSAFSVTEDFTLGLLTELKEKADFVNNEIKITFSNVSIEDQLPIFTTILEMVHVTKFEVERGVLDPALLFSFNSCKIENLSIIIDNIPDKSLLQLTSTFLKFQERSNPNRITATINLILQEWFHKTRKIDCFMVSCTPMPIQDFDENFLKTDALFSSLRFAEVWHYDSSQESFHRIVRKTDPPIYVTNMKYPAWKITTSLKGEDAECRLNDADVAYSVDRGDKKLLVLVSKGRIIAQEYTDLKDVISIVNKRISERGISSYDEYAADMI